ncbi:MAG: electron transport complex subunit RsxC [Gammaproteobacteria bacterium]|nr:MAG: electron transport complex subunit RsxC [Gammaproteobacteria bacterium]
MAEAPVLPYRPQPPRPRWGVRVPPNKTLSTVRPIAACPLPDEVLIPLDCGPAGIATALVQPGQRVATGELIGLSEDGGRVHASLSGIVLDEEEHPVPGRPGAIAPCLRLRSDGEDRWHPMLRPIAEPLALPPAQLRERIAEAGIVGLGGALFPTADKLAAAEELELLIINGAECEPYISCDEMLMRERPGLVLDGVRLMLHASGAPRAVIAVESDMPEAQRALLDELQRAADPRIGIAVVTAKYPAGGERQLIELLTGREVPAGGLPTDIGCLCHNVATAAAVADLAASGRPLISRLVTVTGRGVAEPRNLEARIGTPLAALVAAAGGYCCDSPRLIMGGPMMGRLLPGDELPVTKASNCLIVAAPGELTGPRPEYPCIRCGECSRVCPARLLPQELLLAGRAGNVLALAELQLDACIECGCCDYVCPSHIDLTAAFVQAKRRLSQALRARSRAHQARARSEARAARLRNRNSAVASYQEAELTTDDLAALLERVKAREQERGDAD